VQKPQRAADKKYTGKKILRPACLLVFQLKVKQIPNCFEAMVKISRFDLPIFYLAAAHEKV